MIQQSYSWASVFRAALFTIAKTWEKPKCLVKDE